jgi:HSP20 family protein
MLNLFAHPSSRSPKPTDDNWLDELDESPNVEDTDNDEEETEDELVEVQESVELPIDMYISGNNIVVKAPIIGAREDQISVTVKDQLLTIHKESHEELVSSSAKYMFQECHWGNISRSVELPEAVDIHNTKAKLENGVLTITMPRLAQSQTKIIKIQ